MISLLSLKLESDNLSFVEIAYKYVSLITVWSV